MPFGLAAAITQYVRFGANAINNNPPPSAPGNAVLPSISGATTLGATLTVDTGVWTGSPAPTLTQQWQRYTAGAWTDIATATATTYVTANDGDHRCKVVGSNGVGSPVTAYSNVINVGTTAKSPGPEISRAPQISGNAYSGSTVYALPGDWIGSGTITYAYQWMKRNADTLAFEPISGATATSYVTPDGGTYCCDVVATNASGVSLPARSNLMSVTVAPNPSTAVTKTFTGAASDNLAILTYDPSLAYFPNPNVTENLIVKQATSSVHANNTAGSLQAVYPTSRLFGLRQKVTVKTHQTDTTSQVAMVLRFVDYDNCIICYLGGAGSTMVQKIGGISTTYSLGHNIANGDTISCEINAAGTVVEVRVNDLHTTGGIWPSPITLTQAQPSSGELAGAGLWGTSNAELSSFTSFTVDDFSGITTAPQRDYNPQIFGTATVGSVLTSTRGVWFGSPEPTYAFLWQRWDGAAWVTASGTATNESYSLTLGGDYRCRVTATNMAGSNVATSAVVTVAGGASTGGTHLEGRVIFDETQGGMEPIVAKIEFRATVGGAALTGAASASSEAGVLSSAAKASDTNIDTYWEPSADHLATPYWQQTFPAASAIAQVAMTVPTVETAYVDAFPRSFRIQGWNGTEWVTIKTVTNEAAWTPGSTRTYTI